MEQKETKVLIEQWKKYDENNNMIYHNDSN